MITHLILGTIAIALYFDWLLVQARECGG